ncbi:MAG: hypothetical protein M1281_01695 [Chloroflexi bacterium]|nr:hypothetical protein [Chloroflexota bacterium]
MRSPLLLSWGKCGRSGMLPSTALAHPAAALRQRRPLGGDERTAEMALRNFSIRNFASSVFLILLIFALVYLAIGVGFHFKWKSALAACRETQIARGEFVEPEVFGNALGLAFDVTFWPVYTRANISLDGTPFATPCTH